jgi:hypothetical protein
MDYMMRRNLDLFLAWQEKFRRGWVEPDPWSPTMRYLYDKDLSAKRAAARRWMAECPWRRRRVRVQTLDALAPDVVRGIWTARAALKRGKQ